MSVLFRLIFNLSRRILFLWVRTEKIEKDYSLWNIKDNAKVIYVLEHRSYVDALVVDKVTRELGFHPLSKRTFLNDRTKVASYFSIHNRKSGLFSNKPGIAPRLIELIQYTKNNPDQNVVIVPVTLIWGRGPVIKQTMLKALLSDAWSATGRIKKLFTVLLNGRNTYVEINTPISLRQLADDTIDTERAVRKVSRVLRVHFRRSKARVIGPDLSHRRVLLSQILRSHDVDKAIKQQATDSGKSLESVRASARKYAEEIAANISFSFVRFADIVLTRLWNKIYDGVQINNMSEVRKLAKTHELVYAPCHRSHIDYMLLSYSLYKHGLNIPHIAAGINLNMPVVGSLLRRGGAFFMRRSFKDNRLYAAVFNEYIHQVFAHGHPVEYFVEGGRSRTGKMMPPKAGMLSMTVRSYLRDHNKPVAIIPVYIGYEKVIEDRTFLKELQGNKKKSESVFDIFKTLKKLKNFGQVALNFGNPIILDQFLDKQEPDWLIKKVEADDKPAWLIQSINNLAQELVTNINAAASLNPVNMVASVILASPKQALSKRTLLKQLHILKQLMQHNSYSKLVTMPESPVENWLVEVESRGWLTRHHAEGTDTLYSVENDNAVLMTYYRNNVLHLFALPSMLCTVFNNDPKLRRNEILDIAYKVYPYLKAELYLPWSNDQLPSEIDQWLSILCKIELLQKNNSGYYQAFSPDSLNRGHMGLLSQIIVPTLERYFLTMVILKHEGSGTRTALEIEKESQAVAHRLAILNGLNAPEFFDKHLFRQFVNTLNNKGIIQINEEGIITFDERIENIIKDGHKALSHSVITAISQVLSEYHLHAERDNGSLIYSEIDEQ